MSGARLGAGSCSFSGSGSPLPCRSSASGTLLGPARSPSSGAALGRGWGGAAVLVPARSQLVSLQQVRRPSLREALLGPLCVMGVVEGFLPAGTPSSS